MSSLVSTLRFIAGHPLNRNRKLAALADFAKWQVGARLVPGRVVYNWVNGSRFIVRLGETGLTGNVYCGLHEFPDMAYVLHALSAEDLFVDVGANVGSYTLLACRAKGARGVCFEPVPETFRRLLDNLRLNDLGERVRALNMGIADKPGELRFSTGENCMNHVMADGEDGESVRIDVMPLDAALEGQHPSMLKVDVEGFESPVVDGARRTLQDPALHSVIMELGGLGERYGFDERRIVETMKSYGFDTYAYDPFTRELRSLFGRTNAVGNTLFIRDVDSMRARIAAAQPIVVAGVSL